MFLFERSGAGLFPVAVVLVVDKPIMMMMMMISALIGYTHILLQMTNLSIILLFTNSCIVKTGLQLYTTYIIYW